MIYLRTDEILKRTMLYGVVIVVLTALSLSVILSSQSFLNHFLNFQMQIIITASIVLVLALFIQMRQAMDGTANAKLLHELETANRELAIKNNLILEKQRTMERDLRTTLRLQQTIIDRYKPDLSQIKVSAKTIPSELVGGDFYEFIKPHENTDDIDIVIGDVAGHGIPSSLVTVLCIVLLGELAKEEAHPAMILLKANALIETYLRGSTVPFVTAFYGRFSPSRKTLSYAKAGHNPPLLKRGDTWIELGSRGVFLGTFAEANYEEKEIQLQVGDLLVFYTDGITEARSSTGEQYGQERLQVLIDRLADQNPWILVDHIFDDVDTFSKHVRVHDDQTVIVLAV